MHGMDVTMSSGRCPRVAYVIVVSGVSNQPAGLEDARIHPNCKPWEQHNVKSQHPI